MGQRSAMRLLLPAVLVLLLPLCRAACECTYTNTDFECPTIGPEGNKTVGCEMGVSRFCVDGRPTTASSDARALLALQDIGKGMNITTPDQCGTLCMAAVKCFRSTFIPPPPADGGNATTGICLVSFLRSCALFFSLCGSAAVL